MKQTSLFDQEMPAHCISPRTPPPEARKLARRTDSVGSQQAAEQVTNSGTAAAQAERIEALVHRRVGMTADEIAQELGDLTREQVGKRLPHIASIRKGDESVARRCSVKRTMMATWWPKDFFGKGGDE